MDNILLLDDNPELLEMFHMIFTMHGYQIRVTDSPNLFIEELNKKRPDLIILDILLRNFDGRDLCKDLKIDEATQNIPIILMSASPEKLKYYKEYCADEFLEKPFTLPDLIRKVKALLINSKQY